MTCPTGLHGNQWCTCPSQKPPGAEERKVRGARLLRDFWKDVTAGSVVRDYEYRHAGPKWWSGWRWEVGHRCDGGEIKAGAGDCSICY